MENREEFLVAYLTPPVRLASFRFAVPERSSPSYRISAGSHLLYPVSYRLSAIPLGVASPANTLPPLPDRAEPVVDDFFLLNIFFRPGRGSFVIIVCDLHGQDNFVPVLDCCGPTS